MNSGSDRSNTVQLILGTGAFALCFAVFWLGFRHDAGVEEAISSCACSGQYRHGHSGAARQPWQNPVGIAGGPVRWTQGL